MTYTARHEQPAARTDPPPTLPAWLLVPGAAFLVVSLAAVFLVLKYTDLMNAGDLQVYLWGGTQFREGLPAYEGAFDGWPFTYPPVTLLVFAPLSLLSLSIAMKLMMVGTVTAIGLSAYLVGRMRGYQPGPGLIGAALAAAGLGIWLEPVLSTLRFGQVNAALMLLVVADFALAGRRRWPTGALIGVAAAFKIVPGIFIIYLLLTRRFKAAAVATGTAAGLTLLSAAVRWSDSSTYWFGSTFSNSDRVAGSEGIGSAYNQSLHGMAARFFGEGAGNYVYYLLALVVAVGGLYVARRAYLAGDSAGGMLATALTGLLVSPVSWTEHWVWIVPVAVYVADRARQLVPQAARLAPALPVLLLLPFLVWPLPAIEDGQKDEVVPRHYLVDAAQAWKGGDHGLFPLAAGSVYSLVALVLLALAWWTLRGGPALEPPPDTATTAEWPVVPRQSAPEPAAPVAAPVGYPVAGRAPGPEDFGEPSR